MDKCKGLKDVSFGEFLQVMSLVRGRRINIGKGDKV